MATSLADARWTAAYNRRHSSPIALILLSLCLVASIFLLIFLFKSTVHPAIRWILCMMVCLVGTAGAVQSWSSSRNIWSAFAALLFPAYIIGISLDLDLLPNMIAPIGFVILFGLVSWRANALDKTRLAWANTGNCLACGYDLRMSRDRCPECGMPFQPITRCHWCHKAAWSFLPKCPDCKTPLQGHPVVTDQAPCAINSPADATSFN